ncbi:22352_t:CDS:2 [Dentiscutata erythropus]|uniref:22352_t:CDS:1 n=1 Tax=Dentiscutata erythropus TaxID=1348616 RepID=A0A9N9A9J1_9GLOM|nr:22352_t:CDS:2 [Dentiscutata erythropus]
MSSQFENSIENIFSEIENLIRQDEIQNQSNIEEKFKKAKSLIDELEEDDEKQYGFYRHKYHVKYASYLRIVGETERANKQENRAKNFEQFVGNSENESETEPTLLTDSSIVFNPKEECMQEAEEQLEKLENSLKKKDFEAIQEEFKRLYEIPKTLENYKKVIDYEQIDYSKANVEELITSLSHLKILGSEIAYHKRIFFMRYTLNSSDKIKVLFDGVSLVKREINKRYRELAMYFHSDRTSHPNTPIWLRNEHKTLGDELFEFIAESKQCLLVDMEKVFHEEKAHKFWEIAVDYRNAAKEQWDKLKVLRQEEIKECSSKDLERLSITNGKLAYEEYRASCELVDKTDLKKRIKLRKNMALCLYLANQLLEAQLYALSAIHLLLKDPMVNRQDYMEAKQILDKVRDNNYIKKANDNVIDLVRSNQRISAFDIASIQHTIKDDIEKIITELMLKPDYRLVRCQVSGDTLSTIYFLIYLLINPFYLLVRNNAHEKYNKIITDALNAHCNENYQKFLEILSTEYKAGVSILKFKEREDAIVPKDIIDKLRNLGVRPDAIAYLLILLGEVLTSGRIKIEGKNVNNLKAYANDLFYGALNEKLVADAKKLDDKIHKLRKGNSSKDSISKEDDHDAQEMPFVSRLEEMRNIARINISILNILSDPKQAIEIVKEIRESINHNYQFVSTVSTRLETLEDYLWIISGDEISEFFEGSTELFQFKGGENKFICYLNEQLRQTSSTQEKIRINNELMNN